MTTTSDKHNPPSRPLVSLWGLLQVASLAIGIFTIAAQFGSLSRWCELLSHFTFQYGVLALGVAVIFACGKRRSCAFAMMLVALVNGYAIVPWYFSKPAVVVDNGIALRIMQSNVLSQNSDYARVIALIKKEQPDIVVLQEVTGQWRHELKSLAEPYPHQYWQPRVDNFGMAVLSRLAISAASWNDWGPANVPSFSGKVEQGARTWRLIATHPVPPISDFYYQARNQQLEEVVRQVKLSSDPVVVVGDLNTTVWSADYRQFEQQSGLRNARQGVGMLPTWPRFFPPLGIGIDHVLVSESVTVVDAYVAADVGSDHWPLVVDLEIGEPQ